MAQAKRVCESDVVAVKHLSRRGISLETARRCGVQYEGERHWLIFPLTAGGFNAVSVDRRVPVSRPFYGTKKGIFNPSAAYRENVSWVFLTDSIFDCLAIEQVGGSAIGLFGCGGSYRLLEVLEKKPSSVSFVVCEYSHYNEPRRAEVKRLIESLGGHAVVRNLCGSYRHIHDRLLADCEGLKADVGAFL